jgi:hypothetical protein
MVSKPVSGQRSVKFITKLRSDAFDLVPIHLDGIAAESTSPASTRPAAVIRAKSLAPGDLRGTSCRSIKIQARVHPER